MDVNQEQGCMNVQLHYHRDFGNSVNLSVTLSEEVIQEAPLLCKNITASLGCLSTLESEDCQHLSGLYSSLVMLICLADTQHASEEQGANNVCWTKSFEQMPFGSLQNPPEK